MYDQMTLYRAVTIPYALPVVPSKALVKLSGFSTLSAPPRAACGPLAYAPNAMNLSDHTQPATMMIKITISLITPSKF
jgi:hypothetical protein